eukprot:scaffold1396_cov252-Pinguiococcus_pyrenoidosus.AAC.21
MVVLVVGEVVVVGSTRHKAEVNEFVDMSSPLRSDAPACIERRPIFNSARNPNSTEVSKTQVSPPAFRAAAAFRFWSFFNRPLRRPSAAEPAFPHAWAAVISGSSVSCRVELWTGWWTTCAAACGAATTSACRTTTSTR